MSNLELNQYCMDFVSYSFHIIENRSFFIFFFFVKMLCRLCGILPLKTITIFKQQQKPICFLQQIGQIFVASTQNAHCLFVRQLFHF